MIWGNKPIDYGGRPMTRAEMKREIERLGDWMMKNAKYYGDRIVLSGKMEMQLNYARFKCNKLRKENRALRKQLAQLRDEVQHAKA